MNKPALELIALADALDAWGSLVSSGYEVPGAGQVMTEAAHVLRTAANQSDGVDALRERDRDIGILLANIRFLENTVGEWLEDDDASMVRQIEREHKERATPPAQPAPASDYDYETNDPMGVVRDWPSHGKPDGAVREAITYLRNLEEYMMEHDIDMKLGDQRPPSCVADDLEAALHSPKIAAAETNPGDVLAVKEAEDTLDALRWTADRVITNYENERVWLKQTDSGITDCCLESEPCAHHAKLTHQARSTKQ